MVARGQFLERPAIIAVDDELFLEGLYHRGENPPGLLLCPPLDEPTGMEAPPVAELAFAAARAGCASLRFQHRGRGASGGSIDLSKAVEDAERALSHLIDSDGELVAVAGYLSGAKTALELAERHRFSRIILVAPPELPIAEAHGRLLVIQPAKDGAVAAWQRLLRERRDARLEVIGEADRTFQRGLTEINALAMEWLGEKR